MGRRSMRGRVRRRRRRVNAGRPRRSPAPRGAKPGRRGPGVSEARSPRSGRALDGPPVSTRSRPMWYGDRVSAPAPLWLSESDVTALLDLDQAIAALEHGLGLEARGDALNMP